MLEVVGLSMRVVTVNILVLYYQSKFGCVNKRYLVDITMETELFTFGGRASEPDCSTNGGMLGHWAEI